MGLTASTAPDLTEGIPAVISARTVAAAYANSGVAFDVAVGGLPFVMATSDSRPYRRQTADTRKQQIDTSKEAGEQTLDQWWTRSQDSWHRGEGIVFYEPGSDDGTQYRYGHSVGVDVWTKGQVSLLRSLSQVVSVSTGQVPYVATAGTGTFYSVVQNSNLTRHGPGGTVVYTTSGVTPATPPTVAGSKVLVGHAAGIDVGDSNGSTLTRLYASTGATLRPWWSKSRIIATRGPDLWELPLNNGGSTAMPATPTYTHPLSTWTWTAVSDSPGAILAAGHSDGQSAVYKFALEDSGAGSTPQLGQAFQVAEFPPGEEVHALRVYLGQYVAIGTSRGVRLGVVDTDGSMQYGPLIVETASPVLDLSARDSFVYASVTNAIDGKSGCVRINLGEELEPLRYAYAWDAQTHVTGNATAVGFVGNTDRVVVAVEGQGVFVQSATAYEPTGYVTSARIRYATSELKSFLRARVGARAQAPGSGVAVTFVDNRGAERFIFRLTDVDGDGVDLALSQPTPLPNAQIKLTLSASTDLTETPYLDSMLLKALPAVRRQRLIQYQLSCFDRVKDRANNNIIVDNGAALRLFALEDMESTQSTVLVQDFRCGDTYEAQIESLEFTGTTPGDKSSSGFGGFISLTCRRLV